MCWGFTLLPHWMQILREGRFTFFLRREGWAWDGCEYLQEHNIIIVKGLSLNINGFITDEKELCCFCQIGHFRQTAWRLKNNLTNKANLSIEIRKRWVVCTCNIFQAFYKWHKGVHRGFVVWCRLSSRFGTLLRVHSFNWSFTIGWCSIICRWFHRKLVVIWLAVSFAVLLWVAKVIIGSCLSLTW